jgi:excisionase family DNA binding protein
LGVGLITTIEAASVLKVTTGRVRQLLKEGQLHSEKRGRDHLLDSEEVNRFNQNNRRKAGRPKNAR